MSYPTETDMMRYPPTGNAAQWVRYGPEGPGADVDNFRGRAIRRHEHIAPAIGHTCDVCGFPWWPESS